MLSVEKKRCCDPPPTLFLCDWFVPREHLQKSITFRTSDDSDSNLMHLLNFPLSFFFFVLWCTLCEKQLTDF